MFCEFLIMVKCDRFAIRLAGLKESSKFMESGADMSCHDLRDFVKFIKENHGLKYAFLHQVTLSLSSKVNKI